MPIGNASAIRASGGVHDNMTIFTIVLLMNLESLLSHLGEFYVVLVHFTYILVTFRLFITLRGTWRIWSNISTIGVHLKRYDFGLHIIETATMLEILSKSCNVLSACKKYQYNPCIRAISLV